MQTTAPGIKNSLPSPGLHHRLQAKGPPVTRPQGPSSVRESCRLASANSHPQRDSRSNTFLSTQGTNSRLFPVTPKERPRWTPSGWSLSPVCRHVRLRWGPSGGHPSQPPEWLQLRHTGPVASNTSNLKSSWLCEARVRQGLVSLRSFTVIFGGL